jgi:hypothetical protein
MTRWLVLFGCVFAFAVAAPMGFKAEARKQSSKMCTETTMEGKKVKWRCTAKQSCCFNWFTYTGACCSGM